jgi:hypothetical protein
MWKISQEIDVKLINRRLRGGEVEELGFKGLVAEVVLRFRRLSLSRRHVPLPVDLGLGVSLERRALTRKLGTGKEAGKESEMEDQARGRGGCRNPAGAATWERCHLGALLRPASLLFCWARFNQDEGVCGFLFATSGAPRDYVGSPIDTGSPAIHR